MKIKALRKFILFGGLQFLALASLANETRTVATQDLKCKGRKYLVNIDGGKVIGEEIISLDIVSSPGRTQIKMAFINGSSFNFVNKEKGLFVLSNYRPSIYQEHTAQYILHLFGSDLKDFLVDGKPKVVNLTGGFVPLIFSEMSFAINCQGILR